MMSDTERIEELEKQIAELKNLKTGPPGPRGGAGDIAAAVANAEKVVDDKLESLFARVDEYAKRESGYGKERSESLRRELDQFRKEVRESLAQHFEDEATKTRVENAVLTILHEYGVKSSFDDRVIPID